MHYFSLHTDNGSHIGFLIMTADDESEQPPQSGQFLVKLQSETPPPADIARLLANAGIIRNRRKIQAAIHNAQQIHRLQQQYGSFKNWLDAHHPRSKEAWVRLFKQQFKFMGNEIVGEFLMSTGYLAGAHEKSCPQYRQPENP